MTLSWHKSGAGLELRKNADRHMGILSRRSTRERWCWFNYPKEDKMFDATLSKDEAKSIIEALVLLDQ
jgi:hypothetical protein